MDKKLKDRQFKMALYIAKMYNLKVLNDLYVYVCVCKPPFF